MLVSSEFATGTSSQPSLACEKSAVANLTRKAERTKYVFYVSGCFIILVWMFVRLYVNRLLADFIE